MMSGLVRVAMVALLVGGVHHQSSAQAVVEVTLERDGEFVSAPAADDFGVAIAGMPSRVLSVSCERRPLSLFVLVDMSRSATRGSLYARRGQDRLGAGIHDYPGLVDGVKNGLLRALAPGDRLRVGGFAGHTLRTSDRFTPDISEQESAVDTVLDLGRLDVAESFGPSPIWDAAATAVSISEGEPGLRVLMLVTDGRATGNRLGMADLARLAAAASVPIHVVFEPHLHGLEPDPHEDGDRFLRPLAELTGGTFRVDERLEQFSFWGSAPPPFEDVLEAARHTCTLMLGPDASPGDEVSVEVRQPDTVVHAPRWLSSRDGATSP